MKIHNALETYKIEDLVPYVNNSRTHSDEQVAQIASSIREFGFTNPVLIDESGGVIAGHGRILAAEHLGLVELPCLRLEGLTAAQMEPGMKSGRSHRGKAMRALLQQWPAFWAAMESKK